MKDTTLEFRDALLLAASKGITFEAKEPEFIEFADKKLRVGRYGRAKGYAKAFLIVSPDGNVYYQNKSGVVSNRLTVKAFLTHWDAGMNTFLDEI